MSRSFNPSSPSLTASKAAASCMTAYAVERSGEGATFELDAWQLVPAEHGAWREAKRRYDQLAKALDSVPADHRFGSAFDAICVRVDRLMDDVAETERVARAAFRVVAA